MFILNFLIYRYKYNIIINHKYNITFKSYYIFIYLFDSQTIINFVIYDYSYENADSILVLVVN